MPNKKVFRADVEWKDSNALSYAVFENDRQTLDMVRDAVAQGRVRLAYQPVVMAGNTSRVAFYEGLMRVLDQSGRPIPARAFMAAVEAHEIGREIDCVALALGLRTLAQHPRVRLAINMSARSIGYPKWLRVLRHHLAETPRIGERLILEISETSAMQLSEIVLSFMRQWRGKGISFAMDDYGSGQISIPQLKAFEFDILKIDGQFTRNIHVSTEFHAITAALLAVGKQFERICVAEAVETPADAAWLAALGLDMLQGYAFGAPTVNPDWMLVTTQKTA
ncbi:EAL domain-containing protein [Thioclava sp. FR2]|uniref:EAL domain-containing protein n=1 Tax=Thioclava sp. FR2 TaxID=3445780 RepID=UPI003EB90430